MSSYSLNVLSPFQNRNSILSELKTEFENRLCEKEADFERQRANWETQMNEANEDHANQLATLQSNHSVQLNNYRELHEAALETLEREKKDILEGRISSAVNIHLLFVSDLLSRSSGVS